MERRTAVIIVAGGSGTRCGGPMPKQFRLLGGRPVLARTIDLFASALRGAEIVVVLPAPYIDFWHDFSARFDVAAHTVVAGGEERFYSVKRGLEALRSEPELIAVHDAVRPFATPQLIRRVADAAAESGAAIPVVVPVDSFREVDSNRADISEGESYVLDRSVLRIVQTPQIFRADRLTEAYRTDYDAHFTDDATVVEAAGHRIRLVEGEAANLKITTADDLTLAEALLTIRERIDSDERNSETHPHAAPDRADAPSAATDRTPATETAE